MDSVLILAHVRLNELDFLGLAPYITTMRRSLESVSGFLGLSAWQRVHDRMDVLIVYQYKDHDSAERGLIASTETRLLAEEQTTNYRPADVTRVLVTQHRGKAIHDVSPGFLSISSRVSDPGYGDELHDEIERIFEELRYIPGHLGSVSGPNDSLTEEVVGIVLWDSENAFRASIPPSTPIYEVRLYHRVA